MLKTQEHRLGEPANRTTNDASCRPRNYLAARDIPISINDVVVDDCVTAIKIVVDHLAPTNYHSSHRIFG